MGGMDGVDMPVAKTDNPKKTAKPLNQESDEEKRNKAMAASLLTRQWSEPKLAKKGLLGAGEMP